jgi:hypothetical protein
MHWIRCQSSPQHEAIRFRSAGGHAEREWVIAEKRTREQTCADTGGGKADAARSRLQEATACVIRHLFDRQPAHAAPAATPGLGARSMRGKDCVWMATPLRRGFRKM